MTSTDAGTRPHLPTGSGGLTLYGGPELVADAYARGSWDGVVLPYVPMPFDEQIRFRYRTRC